MTIANNVIEARFNGRERRCVIGPLWQYDYGQMLKISGFDLPDTYEVHFSNDPLGVAKVVPADRNGVSIPDEYLTSGASVFAWLFLHVGSEDGATEYQIEITVRRRAKPTSRELTQVERDVITDLIAEMTEATKSANTAKDFAEQAAIESGENQEAAETAAQLAKSYAEGGSGAREGEETSNAKYWCETADGYRAEALESKNAAAESERKAAEIADTAKGYSDAAKESADNAHSSEVAAGNAQTAAEEAQRLSESAKAGAEAAKTGLEEARDMAKGYASDAQASADAAADSATKAQQAAAEKGWMYVEGKEDGHLYLYTENIEGVTLKDVNGRLIAVYG